MDCIVELTRKFYYIIQLNISHRVNNPLAVFLSMLTSLQGICYKYL